MKAKKNIHVLIIALIICIISSGCGQIGMPTGGPKDVTPPRLSSASPPPKTTNFTGNTITLTFDEYIEIRDIQTNIIISPYQKVNPTINFKLKTVSIKLKDTLLPNTTYTINFGNAIADINEGNVLNNFTYIFSTGNTIDSLQLTGKVFIAETGKVDSTLMAMLYRSTDDSAVQKRKPDYISRINSEGDFFFYNLPAGNVKVYALKDNDGSKTYNSKKELLAFLDTSVTVSENTAPVTLYASAIEKDIKKTNIPAKSLANKKLRYTTSSLSHDLLSNFELTFNNPLKKLDSSKIIVTDTNYSPVATQLILDSSKTKITLATKWKPDIGYRLIIDQNAVTDSLNNKIFKTDTISFTTKKESDYGKVILRFSNIDLLKHPVLQFVQEDEVKESYPIKDKEWSKNLFIPGEYELRILYDENNNGKWDPGNYFKKLQPEKAISLSQKLSVRANWDNELDVKL